MNNNYFKFDTFHSTLSLHFPSINYREIHNASGEPYAITTNHVSSKKSIIFFIDEPAYGFKELDTNLLNYFYNDCEITYKTLVKISINYHKILTKYFHFNEFIKTEDLYSVMAGSDWPSYDDFKNGTKVNNTFVQLELKKFKKNLYKSLIKEYIIELERCNNFLSSKVKVFLESLDKKNTLICVCHDILYEYFKKHGYTCLYIDVHHLILGDLLSIKKLPKQEINVGNADYNYYFLNHRFSPDREETLKQLNEKNLLKYGYVTQQARLNIKKEYYNLKNKYKNVQYNGNLCERPEFKRNYNTSFHKNQEFIDGIGYSSCVKNLFFLNKNIKTNITLISETNLVSWYVTEKTVQPFYLKRIPIILGAQGLNNFLEKEGFDIFRDIVDYEFDSIPESEKKFKLAIENNKNILKHVNLDSKIKNRLDYNHNYLLNEWLDKRMNKIIDQIKEFLE